LSLYLTKYNAMKTYGGVEVWIHAFLISALMETYGQLHLRLLYPPPEELPVHIG